MDAQSIVSEMEFYIICKYTEIKQHCACTCLRTYVRYARVQSTMPGGGTLRNSQMSNAIHVPTWRGVIFTTRIYVHVYVCV